MIPISFYRQIVDGYTYRTAWLSFLFRFVDRCPITDGYIQFRTIDGCYKPQPDKSGAYYDADSACVADGAHLVKFDDVTEKTTITTVLSASSGLYFEYCTDNLRQATAAVFDWEFRASRFLAGSSFSFEKVFLAKNHEAQTTS